MIYTIAFLDEIQDDLIASFDYYEQQAVGLGDEFLTSVDAAIHYIRRHPLQYQKIFLETRKINLRRFPSGVYYVIDNDKILITAVMHLFRNPTEWKLRAI